MGEVFGFGGRAQSVATSPLRRATCLFVVVMLCLTSIGSIGSLGATGSIGSAGIAPVQAQAACGVLSNGGFEEPQIEPGTFPVGGATGWSGDYGLRHSDYAHTGSQYIHVDYSNLSAVQVLDTTGIAAGTTITISFYLTTDEALWVNLNSTGQPFFYTAEWEQYSITYTTRVDAEQVTLEFTNPDARFGSNIDTVTATCLPGPPPPPQSPTFSGSKATITNAASTPNNGMAKVVYDGSLDRHWRSDTNTPSSASLRIDLGSTKSISGVRWKFWSYLEAADSFHVRLVSASGSVLKTYGPYGNGFDWESWWGVPVAETVNARYVHFVFTNPNQDPWIGGIAEVEVWHNPAGNPGTQNPSFAGTKATISNSASTPNTGTARNAHDGSTGTNWHSGHVTPSSASLRLDLGAAKPISGVKWKFQSLGFADSFTVRLVSAGGSVVTEYGPFTNATAAQAFFGVKLSSPVSARYVHLVFTNPNRDTALGSVSEVEVWAQATMTYPPGTQNPVPLYPALAIRNSASTPNTGTSKNTYDGATWSNWAAQGSPTTASLRFDLGGGTFDVTDISWAFSSLGYADKFTIRLVNYSGQVTDTFGPFGNATAAKTWFGVYVPRTNDTRYVHFIFENPNKDVALGAVAEVKIYGRQWMDSGSVPELKSAWETGFAGEVLPVEDTQSGSSFQASSSSRGPQPPQSVTYDLGEAQELTGVRWQSDQETVVGLAWSADGQTWTDTGMYASLALPGTWQGTSDVAGVEARYLRVTYHPISARAHPVFATNLEIWGLDDEPVAATPMVATPEASPIPATPVPAQPEASPVPATPEPVIVETPAPSDEATDAPTEIPATPQPAEEESTTEPSAEPTATETVEPTATDEPTTAPTEAVTPEPTLALTVGTITGTDGDLVNCRISPVDGWPIVQLAEGDRIDITGPAVDGWVPVLCMGQPGFVSEAFVTFGEVAPTEAATEPTEETTEPTATTDGEATVEPTAAVTVAVTEEPTLEPTAEPTEEPAETPYQIVDTGDTENSGTAWFASDNDPATAWLVTPFQNPEQTRLYLDLGSVQPIDRLSIELAWPGSLPRFEIWLSEDGETWYNATPNGIDGWNLWADEAHVFGLGYDARYIRIVIPNVDDSGLSEVGGIRQIDVWPGNISQTKYLTALGAPTTPTPTTEPPLEPTQEVIAEPTEEIAEEPTEAWVEPTEEVIAEPTEAWIEPTVEEIPAEEGPPADGGEDARPEEEAAG